MKLRRIRLKRLLSRAKLPVWVWVRRRSNKPPIDPSHPEAPPNHLAVPGQVKPRQREHFHHHVVYYANLGLKYAGNLSYTQTAARSELFDRKPGKYADAHADCSTYCAAILHWCGNKQVTKYDYTGTLLKKGKLVDKPSRGLVAIWGPGTGAHAAVVTEHIAGGTDWYCVGFGHQGAPTRTKLSDMARYFWAAGEPGVRYLDFAP